MVTITESVPFTSAKSQLGGLPYSSSVRLNLWVSKYRARTLDLGDLLLRTEDPQARTIISRISTINIQHHTSGSGNGFVSTCFGYVIGGFDQIVRFIFFARSPPGFPRPNLTITPRMARTQFISITFRLYRARSDHRGLFLHDTSHTPKGHSRRSS